MFSVDTDDIKLVGGLAGLASFSWQIGKEIVHTWRSPHLKIFEYDEDQDVLAIREHKCGDGSVESRRYICLRVGNTGWRTARGCIAWARAIPVAGTGKKKAASLHWADSPIVYSSTISSLTAVDVLPRILPRRLDVLVATSNKDHPFYLCSPQALHGNHFGDSELAEGEYLIDVFITFEDGSLEKSKLRVTLSSKFGDVKVRTV